ncbi:M23 family metallopeptidase [Roseovarius sp. D22-M7]|uniref:M23 family metallopeptidase n=1 Tax=Roseovarius sp. D22-M7 TaxID=3127116 RepID=UPI00301047AC
MAKRSKIATKFILPVDESRATETFGFGDNSNLVDKGINGGSSTPDWYHIGVDYDYFTGTQDEQFIFAVANGEVHEIGLDDGSGSGYGNYVILRHTLPGNGQEDVYSFYAHMEEAPLVEEGDFVDIGETLGFVGETGFVIGEHLHFEMRLEDPNFTQGGIYSGSYDTLPQFNQGVAEGVLFDPDEFVRDYETTSALMKDFTPDKPGLGNVPLENLPDVAKDRIGIDTGNEVTVNFEDATTLPGGVIADGYLGLDWDNFILLDPEAGFVSFPSGYSNGTVSGDIIALNAFTDPASISDTESDFDLESAYFTAAWNDGLILDVFAYDDGILTGRDTIELNTQDPVLYYFGDEFSSIDELRFESSGGVNAGFDGSGTQFVVDDLSLVIYDEFLF